MALIPHFASVKVLVIGDLMLDQYQYGDTKRIVETMSTINIHL